MKLIIINGPNLNLLGVREKSIYGDQNFEQFFASLHEKYNHVELDYFQSNHEGDIIDKIHEVGFSYDGIILNAGGLTHTSVSLTDAVAGVQTKTLEVHISNIHAREEFRHHSFLTKNCVGIIAGLGLKGYELAINFFLNK
jgi:3-dehydroquinate dehydratase-2